MATANSGVSTFHGDYPVVLQILGEIHRGHAAGPQLTFEAIAVGKRGGQAFEQRVGLGCRVGHVEEASRRMKQRAMVCSRLRSRSFNDSDPLKTEAARSTTLTP